MRVKSGVIAMLLACVAVPPFAEADALGPKRAAPAAAGCPNEIIIGVRGSGESKTPAEMRATHGMGPSVHHMATRMRSRLQAQGDTVRLLGIPYAAADVDRLAPSRLQVALLGAGRPVEAVLLWRRQNLGPFLASLKQGIDLTHDAILEITSHCPDTGLILAGYSQGAMAVHAVELRLQDEGNQDALDAVLGTLLLADGDRIRHSSAHQVGEPPALGGIGVRSYLRAVPRRDVPHPDTTVDICTRGDIVCDFSPNRLRGGTSRAVHGGYLRGNRARVLNRSVDWLAGELLGG